MTDRLLRALENPYVDILGHPTGRLILRREPYPVDIDAVLDAAARHGVAVEINCQVDRLDLNDVHARLARDRGVSIVISSDAHSTAALRLAAVGRPGRAARLARAAARPQHAPVRGVQGCCCGRNQTPMTPIRMLTADDKLAEIRRLYFKTTRQTIQDDLAKALDLLKSMNSEEERERATVFMEGLAEMYKDWMRQEETKEAHQLTCAASARESVPGSPRAKPLGYVSLSGCPRGVRGRTTLHVLKPPNHRQEDRGLKRGWPRQPTPQRRSPARRVLDPGPGHQ